jgi:hypothetical protein
MSAEKKYPGNYFRQFIAMLQSNYADKRGKLELSEENVNDLILMYVHIEGEEEFRNLQTEVKEISSNKDLGLFTKSEVKNIRDLGMISDTIIKHH